MDKQTLNRILDVQDAALTDSVYQMLYVEYKECSDRFLALLSTLPEHQRAVLEDFLGITAAMHLRLLELAVQNSF